MSAPLLTHKEITSALTRLSPYLPYTPILTSQVLNQLLEHEIFFKAECLQKIKAFKVRGALNAILCCKEQGNLPKKVISYSSGNHAQGVAWACKLFGIECEIFMPSNISKVKYEATLSHGAKVVLTQTRVEAEKLAAEASKAGALVIPPFDHDQVICGQGTLLLEALEQNKNGFDAVFAPCGGGGLLSGLVLAAQPSKTPLKVFGAEPILANDAVRTLKSGTLFRWENSPETIADGVKTLSVSERTLQYLKKLDGIYEISEDEIIYWTQWLNHLLEIPCEPTSALGMAAAQKWLATEKTPRKILVVLTGGNMDEKTKQKVWKKDYLSLKPNLKLSLS